MIARVSTSTIIGYESQQVDVEADMSNSLPGVIIVGLGAKSVDEAKERMRSAIKNTGLSYPKKRITINLSPADVPKNGSQFDLAIALSILVVSEQIPDSALNDTMVIGELGLDGELKPVKGVIGHAIGAIQLGFTRIIVPSANQKEAQLVEGIQIIAVDSLRQVHAFLCGTFEPPTINKQQAYNNRYTGPDIADVSEQMLAKKGLIIAAAGNHNIIMSGPPGAGKSLLASCLPSILPPLTQRQILETTHLHSLGSPLESIVHEPPFRSPHHTASTISLVGGGIHPRPGEISLAHNGILFLDEVAEFSRSSLEALRQPMESRRVTVSRANGTHTFPANFLLIATKNPCPCGNFGSNIECNCSQQQIDKYQSRLSGPILDRIDLHLIITRTKHNKLLSGRDERLDSASARKLVADARHRQIERQGYLNTELSRTALLDVARINSDAISYLNSLAESLQLSSRGYLKVLRVSRTVADLAGKPDVLKSDIAVALQFRN